jgi:class 3 adenylate cyclase
VSRAAEAAHYRFADFELDPARSELRRGGEPVELLPTPLRLLQYLVEHRDRAVPKNELLDAIWPDAVVSETALTSALKHLRRALGDDGARQEFVRTQRRLGIRFVAEVEEGVVREIATSRDSTPGPDNRQRRLAAILSTDVVGYSRRLAEDEARTVSALEAARARVREAVAAEGGRVVDAVGDNVLAELPSAVAAVRAGLAIQGLGTPEVADEAEPWLQFRIGVHMGEVLADGERIYGDAVNVAARLEPLAPTGGLCVSAAIAEALAGKLPLELEDLGEQTLKNIAHGVRAYRHPVGAPLPDIRSGTAPGITRDSYVGRAEVLASLDAALEDALSGRGAVALLSGEPGIGKTRTVEELAARAEARGAEVVWGRCFEGEGAPPLWPWMQVLGGLARTRDEARLRAELGEGAIHVAAVVSDVRERLPGLATLPKLEGSEQQFLFFESVGRFLARAGERTAIVVVLEDLHVADDSSLRMLRVVAGELQGSHVLLVGTLRDAPLATRPLLAETVTEQTRLPHGRPLTQLEGLEEQEVVKLAAGFAQGELEKEDLERLVARAEGNPLFVRELVQLLGSSARRGERIPQSIQATVQELAGGLSEATRGLLEMAAVGGRESALGVLQRALELPEEVVLDALEEAEAAGLAYENESGERLRFSHALVQEALYEALPRRDRLRFHLRFARALEAAEADRLEGVAAALSHHFGAAGEKGADEAIEYARQAGDHARTQLAFAEAARHYELAADRLRARGLGETRRAGEALVAHAEVLELIGDQRARAERRRALDIAHSLEDPELILAAVGNYVDPLNPQYADDLETALVLFGDQRSAGRAIALAQSCYTVSFPGSLEQQLERSALALGIAREIEDPDALRKALRARDFSLAPTARFEEGEQLLRELLDVELARGDLRDEFFCRVGLAGLALTAAEFDRELARCREIAAYVKGNNGEFELATFDVYRTLVEGPLDEVERLNARALELGVRWQPMQAIARAGFPMVLLQCLRGQWVLLEGTARATAGQLPNVRTPDLLLVRALLEQGREAEARGAYSALGPIGDLPRNLSYAISLAFLAELIESLQDTAGARELLPVLEPWRGRPLGTFHPTVRVGCASRHLGLLELTLGNLDDAERSLLDAIDVEERLRAPTWEALAHFDLSRVLDARDGPGDRKAADTERASARALAERIGMTALLAKLDAAVES